MKIVVIGGNGLIGTKLVNRLRQKGHEVVAASPRSGVNIVTGEGLASALAGANVVVDVANSPTFDDAAIAFFESAGRNIAAAETAAGVKHHVALSVVGTDRLLDSVYFRAKLAQENLIKSSRIPYTLVRATQFFEFLGGIAQFSMVGDAIHLPPALFQPIAADDVADVMADVTLGRPINAMMEIAGPDKMPLDEFVGNFLRETHDSRKVIQDAQAPYFGVAIDDRSLVPGNNPRLGAIHFADWMRQAASRK